LDDLHGSWHLLELPESKISLAIQLTSAALLAMNLVLVWMVSMRLAGKIGLGAAAAILTAFFYPLNHWALQGMEVGLLTLMVTFAVAAYSEALTQAEFHPRLMSSWRSPFGYASMRLCFMSRSVVPPRQRSFALEKALVPWWGPA